MTIRMYGYKDDAIRLQTLHDIKTLGNKGALNGKFNLR